MAVETARRLLKTFFRDTKFPLIQHHVDSFNDFLDVQIPTFIQKSNPFELELGGEGTTHRFIRVYIGGKDGKKIWYQSPVEESTGMAIVPHTCRLDNRTYTVSLYADIYIEYAFPIPGEQKEKVIPKNFENILIGEIPLMLRSRLCHLTAINDPDITGECKFELGGYFIIDGAEKVLLTQELLGNNMFHVGSRRRKVVSSGSLKPTLVQQDVPLDTTGGRDGDFEEITETYAGVRTLSEDGTRGPYSHFLVIPPPTSYVLAEIGKGNLGRYNRLATIHIVPWFSQPVPLISLFRALGVTSDKDLYETILAGVPDKERNLYDDILTQLIFSHEKFIEEYEGGDLKVLANFTRNKTQFEVVVGLHDYLFSHIEGSREDVGALFRRKAYMLGYMTRMAMDVELGRRAPSDRDNMQFKRMKTSGVLMFEEFRRIYREIGKSMLLNMDSRVLYEAANYAKEMLSNLVQPDTIRRFWRGKTMIMEYAKSFKGSWGGRVGIAQELARVSYLAAIHHLRKTDLQIDKSASTAPPRRFYASQVGLMCPIDSPDGSDIGYKKSLAIFAQVSTATPSETIKDVIRKTKLVRETADIHPSTWQPQWTMIFLNSDLFGVCIGDTEEFHRQMTAARDQEVFAKSVSLSWMRINNVYTIYSDAGRPYRPLYRAGVMATTLQNKATWSDISKYLTYVDAFESDSILISMDPFHNRRPSEIHMTFNLSALANMNPYCDHNPGPRSVFSIAQQKQAASWYHTNYMKRFDTIAMMAACPQKPLSQTWLYSEIMGRGGCLPYGENALVAITMYSGMNQEDSVILNGSALKRGMYQTMYYHSYEVLEEMIDPVTMLQTQIANPTKDDSIKRKPDVNYEMLDADGIIKVDSIVDDSTVLVGMLTPILGENGAIKGHRDSSVVTKRGQRGRVDAVYRFVTQDSYWDRESKKMIPAGLRGVKIRIVEERIPTVGDKMASRHSQKGTVGLILDESDMPFTGKGIRPDLIFNPHGIPTRMTIGQFLEAASNKLGIHLGSFVDATPFTTTNRVGQVRAALLQAGFEPYGSEVLYNGQTGEMMDADIFMGPIYYQRLKHMVEDKINYRSTGPREAMTHQATHGRGNEGGMRIGEMERDGLIAHGMSKFLTESMMDRSDKATLQFDKEEGRIATSRDVIEMPYSMALFSQELESMHLTVRIETPSTSGQ